MDNNAINSFGKSAKALSKNPLGIIALFIVLVYGVAGLVTAFTTSFTVAERLPLIWFLVLFPILVLLVFTWLVCKHSNKLYGPSDFKNEENYIRMQMTAVASLTAASTKNDISMSEPDIKNIVNTVLQSLPSANHESENWQNRILWVDDRPDNNIYERGAFESAGIEFTLALSTNEAINFLDNNKFAAIISDMGRKEGPREGYVLLDEIRRKGERTPFFIYASSNLPEHKRESISHGGQGSTNNPQELYQMVMRAIITTK